MRPSRALPALLVAALMIGPMMESTSEASGSPASNEAVGVGLALAVTTIAGALTFLTVDGVYGVQGEWPTKPWAIAQLSFGTALLVPAVIALAEPSKAWQVPGGVLLAVGGTFASYGLLSLILREEDPIPIAIFPTESGAMGAVTLRF